MTKDRVYETAAETAKKIRKTLKEAFPGVKFSVRSSTFSMGSSVYVNWTDGPLQQDVDTILNRFKSGSYDGMQDMYISTGYEWEGKTFMGAKYISSSRNLSPERRTLIEEKLLNEGAPNTYGQFNKRDWAEAERQLIASGELQGYPSQLPEPEATADPEEVVPISPVESAPAAPTGGKVIAFPVQAVRDPVKAAELQAERLMNSLAPEQRLKLQVLQTMFGTEEVAEMLLSGGLTVDDIFRITAGRIFG